MKSRPKHKAEDGCLVASQKQAAQKSGSETSLSSSNQSNMKSLQSFLKEMELLQSSNELQLEEAQLHKQRLEQDLWRSKEAVAALEASNQLLNREQADMRRKVEEARQAISSSMNKVKELETKASQVPELQRHVLQLETEILFCR